MSVTIQIIRDPEADPELPLPSYESEGAAGADVRANFSNRQGITLPPNGRALIPTGLRMEIPAGYEIQVRPRSGLALDHGITVVNAPGTIDSDYRGLIGVILQNTSNSAFRVTHGMRIAQLVVAPVVQARFLFTDVLRATKRGSGGFGSTGQG